MKRSFLAWVSLVGIGTLTTLGVACGGSAAEDVLANGDAGTGSPDGGGGTTTDSGTGGNEAGTGLDGSSPTTDGGPPNNGADGGRSQDAGPGGNTGSIACGSTTCSIPAQRCCVGGGTGGFAFTCVNGATCPGAGEPTALGCTTAANCLANEVCCIAKAAQGDGFTATCKTSCGGGETAQLCDPSQPDAGCTGVTCSSQNIGDWRLPNGFGTCGGVGN